MNSENAISKFVDLQNMALKEYSVIEKSSSLQNIDFFLNAFIREHNEILNNIRRGLKSPHVPKKIDHMGATHHLQESNKIDFNSIQSVLLHICKVEESILEEEKSLLESSRNDMLEGYVAWQEQIYEDAETLYHRFVEMTV